MERGTLWHSWLGHCATSWKVVGLIPSAVIGILHCYNPCGHTMALGVDSASNSNITRSISWGETVAIA